MLELVMVLGIAMVVGAAALPTIRSTIANHRIQSAITSITGAIHRTRHQTIQNGYQYKLTFNKAARTYQIAKKPGGAGSFSAVGSAVPFGSAGVALNADLDLYFSPRGVIGTTAGAATCPTAATLSLTYGTRTKSITVSCYGNVSIS
jgi:Tfp pilus assembly protein FimT